MKKITNRGTGGTAHEEQCETDHREVEAASYPWGWRDDAECAAGGSQSPATPASGDLMLS